MEDFYHYGLSRQELNIRAAHSLYRAGWMLTEINGVLRSGCISPAGFRQIQEQAIALEELQRKFGPPPTVGASPDSHVSEITIKRTRPPALRVMNRGVEAAAAVLNHYGWQLSQVRSVLKPPVTDLDDLSFALIHDLPSMLPHSRSQSPHSAISNFIMLFWLGGLVFLGISLVFHVL